MYHLTPQQWELMDALYEYWKTNPGGQIGPAPSDDSHSICADAECLRDKGLADGSISADYRSFMFRLTSAGHTLMKQIEEREPEELIAGGLLRWFATAPAGTHARGADLLAVVREQAMFAEYDEATLIQWINEGIAFLEEKDSIEVRQALGTAPYRFAWAAANARTKRAAKQFEATKFIFPPASIQSGGRVSTQVTNQLNVGDGGQVAGNIFSPQATTGNINQRLDLSNAPGEIRRLEGDVEAFVRELNRVSRNDEGLAHHKATHDMLIELFQRVIEMEESIDEMARGSVEMEAQILSALSVIPEQLDNFEGASPWLKKLLDDHTAPTIRTLLIAAFVKYGLPAAIFLPHLGQLPQ